MGALGELFPFFPAAPHPPPRRQRPGSGDLPPPSRGSSGAAQPEQEGKGRRGTGMGRKAAATAANPAGWLIVTETGRATGGGDSRGLAPRIARRSWEGVCVQSRVPGAARGRCSAPQAQPLLPLFLPPFFPYRDRSLPRREWGTAGDAAGPAHASASSPAERGSEPPQPEWCYSRAGNCPGSTLDNRLSEASSLPSPEALPCFIYF
ncbi:uncharacterized protein LOC115603387 [Strigops habroptila]|uniref:uncharacterized protein LOC115603387 n=1 Tax=Strigops habroptila TaxID=2489341 RepID=UPI0011CF3DD7|nr:uncharacterized protein LOC115603387 [Strigops habroptila]